MAKGVLGRLPPRAAVLVVEDDPRRRDDHQRRRRGAGYRAICVATAARRFRSLEEERPALMLVDLFMPVMNGAEFLKVVKQPPTAGVRYPRVIMTAANDPMIGVKEDVTVLYKPVDFDALNRLLQKYCEPTAGAGRDEARAAMAARRAWRCWRRWGWLGCRRRRRARAGRFVPGLRPGCGTDGGPARSRARACRWSRPWRPTIRGRRRCTSSSRWGSRPRCCAPTTSPSSSCATPTSAGRRYPEAVRAAAARADGVRRRRPAPRDHAAARAGASRGVRAAPTNTPTSSGSPSTPTPSTTGARRRRWPGCSGRRPPPGSPGDAAPRGRWSRATPRRWR